MNKNHISTMTGIIDKTLAIIEEKICPISNI